MKALELVRSLKGNRKAARIVTSHSEVPALANSDCCDCDCDCKGCDRD